MKALTLTPPWSSLVRWLLKRIETRSWRTEYRGRIAIHAAKGFPDDARYLVSTEPFQSALAGAMGTSLVLATDLPTAAIIAVATLDLCFRFTDATEAKIRARSKAGELPAHEADFGDFSAGRYGLLLTNVIALPEPVPARGMLNLWNVPDEVEAQVNAQLAAIEETACAFPVPQGTR